MTAMPQSALRRRGRGPRSCKIKVHVSLVILFALAACSPAASSGQPGDSTAAEDRSASVDDLLAEVASRGLADDEIDALLYDRAVEEGEVVHYGTGSSLREEQSVAFTEAFPGIEVRYVGGRAGEMTERVLAEHRAQRLQADVIHTSDVTMVAFADDGILVDHHGVIVPSDVPVDHVSATAANFRLGPYVTLWNSDLVTEDDAPRQWDDFLRPEHHGCVLTDGANWFSTLIGHRGAEEMEAWMQDFLANGGELRTGLVATTAAVASGEFRCMVGANVSRAEAMIVDDGAPLAWSVPDRTPGSPMAIGVTATASNPYAAALFVRWVLGPDGQRVLAEDGDVPVLPGVTGPYERLAAFSDPDHAYYSRISFPERDRIVELESQASDLIGQYFGVAEG